MMMIINIDIMRIEADQGDTYCGMLIELCEVDIVNRPNEITVII